MEEAIVIKNNTIRLQAMLDKTSAGRAVVITHPHPLYGGNMDNPVVLQMTKSFARKGFTTLRFNFRGTAGSTGMYDNGQGEQTDVTATLAFLKNLGIQTLFLAGYSFGARINASVVSQGYDIKDHVMVSPPVGFLSFDDIETLLSTGLIITGQEDDIAPPDMVQAHIHRWKISPEFHIIPGCDHFYGGCLDQLGEILEHYLKNDN
ncbi:MAG: alpha/beta hydrolase [Desulfotignum sp.]|nr:alpha/beta hydrolase [Desulfobacteraceae bacterium]